MMYTQRPIFHSLQKVFLLAFFLLSLNGILPAQEAVNFNHDWQFRIVDQPLGNNTTGFSAKLDKTGWENVDLPHTAVVEPVYSSLRQWQGVCQYRKVFNLPASCKGKRVYFRLDAAMQTATVTLNGKPLTMHHGGYLPFVIDLTDYVSLDSLNYLLVELSNQDDPQVPPGKPLADLDFNYYSGLYRGVTLWLTHAVHITDPILENREAGGGVMVWYEQLSSQSAMVNLKAEVRNDNPKPADIAVMFKIYDQKDALVGSSDLLPMHLSSNTALSCSARIWLDSPSLWSPANPYLYRLKVDVMENREVVDSYASYIGIRSFSFSRDSGFLLNGEKLKIRGTNRHQEYPYVGYALSENAQFRDAFKIKKAGFNFVRCSHYPQSTAFLDACDRLGIMVMDAIPGWQFIGGASYQNRSIQDIRDMIHRDRNHPSVILWEASLNESDMSIEYMERAHQTVHRELPFKDVYTCGWKDTVYDVFIPARQHAAAPDYWNRYPKNKPLLIAEYGDWEYYAQNAGFNQKDYSNLKENERTSRQLRGDGPARLMQQALNFQEAHNNNLEGPAVGDANWLMFDYKRGYAPDIESSGIMDIFRLPKYSCYFYQSLDSFPSKDPKVDPMVYISTDWTKQIARIYSNCKTIKLMVDGIPVDEKQLVTEVSSGNLSRPPLRYTWTNPATSELKASAFESPDHPKVLAEYSSVRPGVPAKLALTVDISGKELEAGVNDLVFMYASVVDTKGSLVDSGDRWIRFQLEGDAVLIGENPARSEAGIASILLKAGNKGGKIKLKASATGLAEDTIEIEAKRNP